MPTPPILEKTTETRRARRRKTTNQTNNTNELIRKIREICGEFFLSALRVSVAKSFLPKNPGRW